MVVSSFATLTYDNRRKSSNSHPLLALQTPKLPSPFDNISIIRVQDSNERTFHGYEINGTSYNSYVIDEGNNKFTVIDSCKLEFADQYIASVLSIVHSFDNVHRIIVQHSEYDHSSSIPELYDLTPNAELYANAKCAESMKKFFPSLTKAKWNILNNAEVIELNNNFKLTFLHTPLLHWSDSSACKIDAPSGEGLLLSMDIGGAHIAGEDIYIDEYKKNHGCATWKHEATSYYQNIVAAYTLQTKQFLNKIPSLLPINVIAPAHGPIFRNSDDISQLIELYTDFANKRKVKGKVVIFYETNYNSTAITCNIVANRLRSHGLIPTVMRVSAYDKSDWAVEAWNAESIIFASATLNNTCLPYMAMCINYLGGLDMLKNIPVGLIGHFGWTSNSVTGAMKYYLEPTKAKLLGNDLLIKWRADDSEFEKINIWADAYAVSIMK